MKRQATTYVTSSNGGWMVNGVYEVAGPFFMFDMAVSQALTLARRRPDLAHLIVGRDAGREWMIWPTDASGTTTAQSLALE